MSWTLFIQIVILIMLVGFFITAAISTAREKTPQTIYQMPQQLNLPRMKPTSYYTGVRPDYDLIEGDVWVNPFKGNEVHLWDASKNDWIKAS